MLVYFGANKFWTNLSQRSGNLQIWRLGKGQGDFS